MCPYLKYFSVSQQWVLFVVALFLVGSLAFKLYYYPLSTPSGDPVKEVVVEVLGEVRQPGVYLYQNPPKLKEVIERAGGLKETAQFDLTSSSTILETGTLLTVTREPSQTSPPLPLSKGGQRGMKQNEIKIRIGRMAADKLLVFSLPLDLNHVSVQDLCLIPGIGESLAQEMITYREKRKGFRSVEDLRNVRGIGRKKYETFKKFFVVKSWQSLAHGRYPMVNDYGIDHYSSILSLAKFDGLGAGISACIVIVHHPRTIISAHGHDSQQHQKREEKEQSLLYRKGSCDQCPRG